MSFADIFLDTTSIPQNFYFTIPLYKNKNWPREPIYAWLFGHAHYHIVHNGTAQISSIWTQNTGNTYTIWYCAWLISHAHIVIVLLYKAMVKSEYQDIEMVTKQFSLSFEAINLSFVLNYVFLNYSCLTL